MVNLELTDDEAKELTERLELALSELQREIAATDARDYRLDLHKREQVLRDVVARLRSRAA